MNSKPKIVVSKPRWAADAQTWLYWNAMYQVVCDVYSNDYDIEIFEVTPTTQGITDLTQHILVNQHTFELFLAHHLTSPALPKTITYKSVYYPNQFYFGSGGYSCFSDICHKPLMSGKILRESVYNDFYEQHIKPCLSDTKYKEKNTAPLEAAIPNDFIFVALQVEDDTVMTRRFMSTTVMIRRAIDAARMLGIATVIKIHPGTDKQHVSRTAIAALVKSNSDVFVSTADVRLLLDKAIAVCVMNSGVGFEALCRLKPVFTFAQSDYYLGTFQNYTSDQIATALAKKDVIDPAKLKRFLYNWWQEICDVNIPTFKEKIKNCIDEYLQRDMTTASPAMITNLPKVNMVMSGKSDWVFEKMLNLYKERFAGKYEIIETCNPLADADIYQYWRPTCEISKKFFKTIERSSKYCKHGIHMMHDSPFDEQRHKPGYRRIMISSFAKVFYTSQEQLKFYDNVSASRRVLTPLAPINTTLFKPSPINRTRKLRVGYITRSYPDGVKGENLFFDIIKKLDPNKFELVISEHAAVINDPLLKRFTENAAKKIDVLVICSKYEGTPLPLIEATAAGIYVLTTKCGVASEILPPKNICWDLAEAFVDKLKDIEQDRQILADFKKIAPSLVADRTWDNYFNIVESAYKDML